MPAGTPGFVGARLREARAARSVTAVALSELIGVTPASITQYENGETTPRPDTFESIARALNLPTHFFLRTQAHQETGSVFYRSMSAATKTARLRAESRLRWFQEIVAALKERLAFPPANIPEPDVPADPAVLTPEQIEEAATYCRRAWGLGDYPIANVVALLETNGVVVVREHLAADALDALSVWSSFDGCPYMVLGADKNSAVRSRYDASHELGHLVLHRHVPPTRLRNSVEFKRLEEQAHRFAGAFLLPPQTFANEVYLLGLDAFRALKPRWKASVGAMIKRLSNLGAIPEGQEQRLWMNYARRGWNRWEPLDDELPVEEPQLLKLALEQVAKDVDLPSLAIEFPVHPEEAERMLGLPPGCLSATPELVRFFPRRMTEERENVSAPGQLIHFPRR